MRNWRKNIAKAFGVTMAAGLLAACGAGPSVYNARIYHDRWPDLFFTRGETYDAVVWGNPFGGDPMPVRSAVVAAMTKAYNVASRGFVALPPEEKPSGPYVSVVFNAESERSGLPCANLEGLTPRAIGEGNVHVQAALCRYGTPLTRASGQVMGVTGPDDPRFRQLLHMVAVDLFRRPPTSGIRGLRFGRS